MTSFIDYGCDGQCLTQQSDCNYIDSDACSIECKPVKCPNYIICGQNFPKYVGRCHGGCCMNCAMMFYGKLDIEQKTQECYSCSKEREYYVKRPKCDHQICTKCFKRGYWGYESHKGEPKFPYPKMAKDYFEGDLENLELDPLVIQYNKDYEEWDEMRDRISYEHKVVFGKCSVCHN